MHVILLFDRETLQRELSHKRAPLRAQDIGEGVSWYYQGRRVGWFRIG
jgi:hypothetical protein